MSVLTHFLLFLEMHTCRCLPLALQRLHHPITDSVVFCHLHIFFRICAAAFLTPPSPHAAQTLHSTGPLVWEVREGNT